MHATRLEVAAGLPADPEALKSARVGNSGPIALFDVDLETMTGHMAEYVVAALSADLCIVTGPLAIHGTKVLVVSKSASPADLKAALRAGAHWFVLKT